jgi:replicative DNA helicase
MNEETKTDTLSAFGKEFQTKAISAILSDRAFLERIYDILSPDFFEQDAQKWIIKQSTEYFIEYKNLISLTVFGAETNKLSDDVLKAAIQEQLKKSYKEITSSDLQYIKNEFLEFCKHQKIKSAISDSIDLLKNKQFDLIKTKFDDALKAGLERNVGHEYNTGLEQRMSASCRETVKTGWDIIDKLLDGGMGKGELIFVVAPAGSGKSWILTRAGMSAMKQGKNVLHFTMELNEEYVGLRYDSCFSGIPFQEVRTKKDIVAKSFSDVSGKLVIKFFPLKTITAATLKAHVSHTEMILGIKFDLLVVDYADLLKSLTTNKNSNSYSEGGAVYEELRAVAGELKIPIISASQSQRSQNSEEIIGAEGVADSYKKIMTGDFIFSLSRMTEDKLANTARIHIIKNRLGRDGDSYPCHFDASCGDIRILDPSTVEGMEISKKFKHQQESGKDQIRKKWNQNKDRE